MATLHPARHHQLTPNQNNSTNLQFFSYFSCFLPLFEYFLKMPGCCTALRENLGTFCENWGEAGERRNFLASVIAGALVSILTQPLCVYCTILEANESYSTLYFPYSSYTKLLNTCWSCTSWYYMLLEV